MPREVDAAHDFASVAQDLRNVLQLPSVEWIVLHDYGVENEKEGIVDGLQVPSFLRTCKYSYTKRNRRIYFGRFVSAHTYGSWMRYFVVAAEDLQQEM